jgi:hypothetical protein
MDTPMLNFRLNLKRRSRIRRPLINFAIAALLALCAGCIRTQTVLVQAGQPIRLLSPVTVAGKSTATEVAKGQWIVNDSPVVLPAGAYIVVLPAALTSATQP